jgi:propanediol dehydratase large subunit
MLQARSSPGFLCQDVTTARVAGCEQFTAQRTTMATNPLPDAHVALVVGHTATRRCSAKQCERGGTTRLSAALRGLRTPVCCHVTRPALAMETAITSEADADAARACSDASRGGQEM